MTAKLAGAIRQLIVVLRRQFSGTGNPPIGQYWTYCFPIPPVRARKDIVKPMIDLAKKQVDIATSGALYFSSLIATPPGEFINELLEQIAPLLEVKSAMQDVSDLLKAKSGDSDHARHLFEKLYSMEWSNRVSFQLDFENGRVVKGLVGFHFTPINMVFLGDLEDAAKRLSAMRSIPAIQNELGQEETEIIELLRKIGHRLTTSQILAEFQNEKRIKAESTTKLKLSQLIKCGVLNNRSDTRPRGYGLSEWK